MQLPLVPESCEGCGRCCEGIGSPVMLYRSDSRSHGKHPYRPENLPLSLIEEIDEHFGGLLRGQEPQQQCLWFDEVSRRCRHYQWRPQICRDYELAGSACLIARSQ